MFFSSRSQTRNSSFFRKKSSLEIQRTEKTQLRNSELKEKRELDAEKKEQDKMITRLQDRESKLRKELAEKQKAKALCLASGNL